MRSRLQRYPAGSVHPETLGLGQGRNGAKSAAAVPPGPDASISQRRKLMNEMTLIDGGTHVSPFAKRY
ncbi:MAG: hypothetical protein AAGI34_16365, partial [Pseudomonadota bacterium]